MESGTLKRFQMTFDTIRQRSGVVAAFQKTHQTTIAMGLSDRHHGFGQRFEIFGGGTNPNRCKVEPTSKLLCKRFDGTGDVITIMI